MINGHSAAQERDGDGGKNDATQDSEGKEDRGLSNLAEGDEGQGDEGIDQEEELLHKQERDDVVREWLGRLAGGGSSADRMGGMSSGSATSLFPPNKLSSSALRSLDSASYSLAPAPATPLSLTAPTAIMPARAASSTGRDAEMDASGEASGGSVRTGGHFSLGAGTSYPQDWNVMSRDRSRSQSSLRPAGQSQGQSQDQSQGQSQGHSSVMANVPSQQQQQQQPPAAYDQAFWEHNFNAMHTENQKLRGRLDEMTKVADQWRAEVAILRTKLGIPIGDAARPLAKPASNFGNPFSTFSGGTSSVASGPSGLMQRSGSFRRTSLPHFSTGVGNSRSRPSSPSLQPIWASPFVPMEFSASSADENDYHPRSEAQRNTYSASGQPLSRPELPGRTASLSPSILQVPLHRGEPSRFEEAFSRSQAASGNNVAKSSPDKVASLSNAGIISSAPTLMPDGSSQRGRQLSGSDILQDTSGLPSNAGAPRPEEKGKRMSEATSAMDTTDGNAGDGPAALIQGTSEVNDDWQEESAAASPPLVEMSRETSPTHEIPPSSHWQSLIAAHVAHVSETLAPFAALNQDRFERILALGGAPGGRWSGTIPPPGWAASAETMTLGRDQAAERRLSTSLSERLAGRYNGSVIPGVGWGSRGDAFSSAQQDDLNRAAAGGAADVSPTSEHHRQQLRHLMALSEPPTPRTAPVEDRPSYDWSSPATATTKQAAPARHTTENNMQTSPMLDHVALPAPATRSDIS